MQWANWGTWNDYNVSSTGGTPLKHLPLVSLSDRLPYSEYKNKAHTKNIVRITNCVMRKYAPSVPSALVRNQRGIKKWRRDPGTRLNQWTSFASRTECVRWGAVRSRTTETASRNERALSLNGGVSHAAVLGRFRKRPSTIPRTGNFISSRAFANLAARCESIKVGATDKISFKKSGSKELNSKCVLQLFIRDASLDVCYHSSRTAFCDWTSPFQWRFKKVFMSTDADVR